MCKKYAVLSKIEILFGPMNAVDKNGLCSNRVQIPNKSSNFRFLQKNVKKCNGCDYVLLNDIINICFNCYLSC